MTVRFEMISVVIPVGPEDSSESVKASFTGAYEVLEVRGGKIAEARNLGASRAKGDTLLFTECDMDLRGLDVSKLMGDFDIGSALFETPVATDVLHMQMQNWWAATNNPWMMIGGFMWMRRYVWEALKGFRDTWWDDVEFANRAFWRGFKFGHFPTKVVHKRGLSARFPYFETKFLWGVP